MITCIIIEDNQANSTYLQKQLQQQILPYSVCAICANVEESVYAIIKFKPDLIFLDIELENGQSGFDVLKQTNEISYEVIVTTSFDKYAIDAIRFACIGYLVKPYDAHDLQNALDKFIENRGIQTDERRNVLLQNFIKYEKKLQKIGLPTMHNQLEFVQLDEIIYCHADGNYTYFFMKDGSKKMIVRPMKKVEAFLYDHGFYRIHDSFMVNIDFVEKLQKGSEGTAVQLSNNAILTISRNKKDGFMKYLSQVRGILD